MHFRLALAVAAGLTAAATFSATSASAATVTSIDYGATAKLSSDGSTMTTTVRFTCPKGSAYTLELDAIQGTSTVAERIAFGTCTGKQQTVRAVLPVYPPFDPNAPTTFSAWVHGDDDGSGAEFTAARNGRIKIV